MNNSVKVKIKGSENKMLDRAFQHVISRKENQYLPGHFEWLIEKLPMPLFYLEYFLILIAIISCIVARAAFNNSWEDSVIIACIITGFILLCIVALSTIKQSEHNKIVMTNVHTLHTLGYKSYFAWIGSAAKDNVLYDDDAYRDYQILQQFKKLIESKEVKCINFDNDSVEVECSTAIGSTRTAKFVYKVKVIRDASHKGKAKLILDIDECGDYSVKYITRD